MSNEPKIYCGSGKQLPQIQDYPPRLKLSFNTTDLDKLRENLNEKGWVNVLVTERKSVGKYGETHALTIDTWKPDPSKRRNKSSEEAPPPAEEQTPPPAEPVDDLPF